MHCLSSVRQKPKILQDTSSKTAIQPPTPHTYFCEPYSKSPCLHPPSMTATLPSIGHVPMLVATLACMSFTIIYLAGFYVFVDIRTGGTGRSRNEPMVILARCKAVLTSSVITIALVWILLNVYGAWPDTVSFLSPNP